MLNEIINGFVVIAVSFMLVSFGFAIYNWIEAKTARLDARARQINAEADFTEFQLENEKHNTNLCSTKSS